MMNRRPWVFDCDGVILNSNALKSQAMRRAASSFCEAAANELVAYHEAHGGIGREIKFRYFFEHLLGRRTDYGEDYASLSASYSKYVREALVECEVAPGLETMIDELRTVGVEAYVVSGAEENELRDILKQRQIAHLFSGIFGSPTSKAHNVLRLSKGKPLPDTFIGDSKYDCDVALQFGMKFYFLTDWTDFTDWQQQLPDHPDVTVLGNLQQLHASHPLLSGFAG